MGAILLEAGAGGGYCTALTILHRAGRTRTHHLGIVGVATFTDKG